MPTVHKNVKGVFAIFGLIIITIKQHLLRFIHYDIVILELAGRLFICDATCKNQALFAIRGF